MKNVLPLIILLFLTLAVHSQQYEYGKPEDMKGLTTIYIDTKGNIKDREEIAQEIQKAGLQLTVTDTPETAAIRIEFQSNSSTQAYSHTIQPVPGSGMGPLTVPGRVKILTGEAMVTIDGKTSSSRRVVMNFNGGRRNPAEKFAKEFVKVYKEANGIK